MSHYPAHCYISRAVSLPLDKEKGKILRNVSPVAVAGNTLLEVILLNRGSWAKGVIIYHGEQPYRVKLVSVSPDGRTVTLLQSAVWYQGKSYKCINARTVKIVW